jgi:SAM-dependent methyltransferase
MELLTSGNSAKLYCLNAIAKFIVERQGQITILDLGCGEALNFVRLLQANPSVRYIGLDPDLKACQRARSHLSGLNANILNAYAYNAYEVLREQFDVIVSFSVFEHVYRRQRYLQTLKACLKAAGRIFINYDAGHFLSPVGESFSIRDRIRDFLRPISAKLGAENYYQAFVREQDFRCWIKEAGLTILEAKFFNLYTLKSVYKIVPEAHRSSYMQRWLDFEEELNQMDIQYTDAMAKYFGTRNFILAHRQ